MTHTGDNGRSFEERALSVARAKHDPSGLQGAIMHAGREHDGLFIDETSIVAYEFTQMATKAKAIKDGEKLADILAAIQQLPENRFKSATGYFVTEREPTAEQRGAIKEISRRTGVTIHSLSIVVLQRTLLDIEDYIARRLKAPFGSISQPSTRDSAAPEKKYIEVPYVMPSTGEPLTLNDLVQRLLQGDSLLLVGDYGIGKSAALKEIFVRLRARYFKRPLENPFPLHINLRDCSGLRSPREILQRHAEEIGFPGDRGLIGAWRAGQTTILLDGFDELIPQRWVGSPRDVKSVRWEALAAVRDLVSQSPAGTGIAVAGRSQYFANQRELASTLGFQHDCSTLVELQDFDDSQVEALLGSAVKLPTWVPPRPLLVELLAGGTRGASPLESMSLGPGATWLNILRAVCAREAQRFTSISSETFIKLIGRIAIEARNTPFGLGPVSLKEMERVFYEVCGYEAEGEALQALLRLPGLRPDSLAGQPEARTFIDEHFADAAYGFELAGYISAPYSDHPLSAKAQWRTGSRPLSSELGAEWLAREGYSPEHAFGALSARLNGQLYDAVMYDVCAVSTEAGATPGRSTGTAFIADATIPRIYLDGSDSALSSATFKGCVVDVLDVGDLDDPSKVPAFNGCLIDQLVGWSEVPTVALGKFSGDTLIEHFSSRAETTSSIMSLSLGVRQRVALSILKKVYLQAGSARRASALSRGLPLDSRKHVDQVVSDLVSAGLLVRSAGKGDQLVSGVRTQRSVVQEITSTPARISEFITG